MDNPFEKTLEQHFCSWESSAFGFGYGTGESHVIPALRAFLEACPEAGGYDYKVLEQAVTPVVAWLLINRLCREDIFEYGTSPRYAWLTPAGRALRRFMLERNVDDLIELVASRNDEWTCYRDACNCGPEGYEEGRACPNPFWGRAFKA